MKQNRLNWALVLLGIAGGIAIGVLLGRQTPASESSDMITEHSMTADNAAFEIERAMRTIRDIETENYERVLAEQRLLLSGAFLSLVEMHKQGMVGEDDWVKNGILLRAKDLISERKEIFLGQNFATESSVIDFINEDSSNPVDGDATGDYQDQLIKALQYVERIQQEGSSNDQQAEVGNR